MLKVFLPLYIVVIGVTSLFTGPDLQQKKKITLCYALPEGEGMAAFATAPDFVALHPAPLPLQYDGLGENISFGTADGTDAGGYFIKAKSPTDKWLFVYQEWWGLNDYVRRQADTFYEDLGTDVNVLALDMYDGKVTRDPSKAGKLLRSIPWSRTENIINGGISFAGDNAKIANVGWCYGGGLSLQSGILGGQQTIGTVIYYGMPERDVEKLEMLNGDVLGLFATEERISKEVIEEFAANMKKAGKELDYKIFDAVHGFANPSNPRYDETATREAYGMALEYLKEKFR